MVDGKFKMLTNLPRGFSTIKHASRIRFYTGTNEVIGRLHLLDTDSLPQGGEAMVQFRLESQVAVTRGDRFLIRTFSPMFTIGGGIVLDGTPQKHRNRSKAAAELEFKAATDPHTVIVGVLDTRKELLVSEKILAGLLELPADQIRPHLPPETDNAGILCFEQKKENLFCSERLFLSELRRLLKAVETYHRENQEQPGIGKAELQQTFSTNITVDVFNILMDRLISSSELVVEGNLVARTGFKPEVDKELESALTILRKNLEDKNNPLWTPKAMGESTMAQPKILKNAIGILLNNKELIRLPEGNFASSQVIEEVKIKIINHIKSNGGEADTNELKNLLGLTRKHVIPILEYMDEEKITIRAGNMRRLRNQS
jgi:selenocysteine-specific elongation factor